MESTPVTNNAGYFRHFTVCTRRRLPRHVQLSSLPAESNGSTGAAQETSMVPLEESNIYPCHPITPCKTPQSSTWFFFSGLE